MVHALQKHFLHSNLFIFQVIYKFSCNSQKTTIILNIDIAAHNLLLNKIPKTRLCISYAMFSSLRNTSNFTAYQVIAYWYIHYTVPAINNLHAEYLLNRLALVISLRTLLHLLYIRIQYTLGNIPLMHYNGHLPRE